MIKQAEIRNFPMQWEQRETILSGGGGATLRGYAAIFGVKTEILGLWIEQIERGAFSKTIQEGDPLSLWGHNTDLVLGRKSAGTLSLREDAKGLAVVISLPDTTAGRDALVSVKRRDVRGMSIAFQIIRQTWVMPEDRKELPLRIVSEIKLYEVSPVAFPAVEETSIEAN